MRLGLLVRDDNTGLGYQTRAYYKHLKPHKTIVIDLSPLNGNKQNSWYPDALTLKGIPHDNQLDDILSDIDVLLTAETPYNLNLYKRARELGVKTVCVENPEFYDHIVYPQYELPDLIILPSVWLEDYIREHAESKGTKVIQLHHPVDLEEFPYRERTSAFPIHIAGKPAANDRNGTYDFMNACPEGIVTTQSEELAHQIRSRYRHSTVYTGIEDAQFIYKLGDIMVLPRKYGGNCLPLNEALASGMPVIMTDISPNNHLLPPEWLVPTHYSGQFAPRFTIQLHQAEKPALYEKIEWFKTVDMAEQSRKAYEIAKTISWDALLPKYMEALESL